MGRKSIVLLFAALVLTLWMLLRHQPAFYDNCAISADDERSTKSGEFIDHYSSLMMSVDEQAPQFREEFTTDQVNAFLQHDFLADTDKYPKLPPGFSDVRVQVTDGALKIGCRYNKGLVNTILTIEAKIWLVSGEVNSIGVELGNMRAGALPVSREIILDYISEAAGRSNIAVQWRYHDDVPVAIFRLQANKERPTMRIERFDLQDGRIIIAGRSIPEQ